MTGTIKVSIAETIDFIGYNAHLLDVSEWARRG